MSSLFDNIWFWVLVILIILLVIYAPHILSTLWGWVTQAWGWLVNLGLPWWGWGLLALGLAYLIDPDGTVRFVHDVVSWAGDLVGDIAGAALGGFFSSPIGVVGLILLGIFVVPKLFGRRKDDDRSTPEVADAAEAEAPAPRLLPPAAPARFAGLNQLRTSSTSNLKGLP